MFFYVFLLFLCFPVLSHGFPMVFLCFSMFSCFSYVFLWFSYVFLWFSYGFPMFSCGFPMFPMVSYGFPMVFLCFPMAFACFPMVSTWFPGSPGPSLPLHRDQRRRASRSEHRAAENGRWVSNIEVSEAFDMGISWFNTGYWLLALLVFKLDRIWYFFIY